MSYREELEAVYLKPDEPLTRGEWIAKLSKDNVCHAEIVSLLAERDELLGISLAWFQLCQALVDYTVICLPKVEEKEADFQRILRKFIAARDNPQNAARALLDRLNELEKQERWIPVEESLPDEDIEVLVARADHDDEYIATWQDGQWHEIGCSFPLHGVTHWKHLPEGPVKGKKGHGDAA